MNTPDPRWLLAASGPSHARLSQRRPWGHHALAAVSLQVWATALAALVGFGLLVSFQQVVAQSVVQGEHRRTATAARDRTLWLCTLLNGSASRDQCLARSRQTIEVASSRDVASFVVSP
jgi:hypothetical protein